MGGIRTAVAGLFACLWAVALATSHYGVVSNDEVLYFFTARSIALRGALDVPEAVSEMLEAERGRDGRLYAQYPPGYPALLAPAVLVGRALAVAGGRDPDSFGGRTAEIRVSYVWAAALAAAAGVAPFIVLVRLGASPPAALFAALVLALGTPSVYYLRPLLSDAVRTGLAVAACLPIARLARGGGAGSAAAAGALLGAAALVRLDSIALWPAGAAASAVAARGRGAGRALGAFGAPLAAAAAILAAHNAARFGTPFETGYGHSIPALRHLPSGLYAKVLSPGQGLVVYGPVVFVALAGLRGLARLDRPAATYAVAGAVLVTLLTSATPAWRIGWEWGPRYLQTPWTLVGLGLASLPSPAWRRAAVALGAWGFVVNSLGAASDFTRHYAAVGDVERVVLDPSVWPVAAQARAVLDGRIDLPVVRTWLLALGLAAAGAIGLRAALAAVRRAT